MVGVRGVRHRSPPTDLRQIESNNNAYAIEKVAEALRRKAPSGYSDILSSAFGQRSVAGKYFDKPPLIFSTPVPCYA